MVMVMVMAMKGTLSLLDQAQREGAHPQGVEAEDLSSRRESHVPRPPPRCWYSPQSHKYGCLTLSVTSARVVQRVLQHDGVMMESGGRGGGEPATTLTRSARSSRCVVASWYGS